MAVSETSVQERPAAIGVEEDRYAARWRVLGITLFGAFVVPFNIGAINVAIPRIAADLGLSLTEAVWVQTAFLLTVAVLLIPAGRLGDIARRERVYTLGVACVVAGSVLGALAQNGATLFAAQIVQGIGSAGSSAISTALVTAAFPPRERGRALGIMITSIYSGLTLGPFIGGVLTSAFGWRALFAVAIVCGSIVVPLAIRGLPRTRSTGRLTLDWRGALLLAGGLIALLVGLTRGPSAGWDDPAARALIALGLALLVALAVVEVARERAGESVLIQPRLFTGSRAFTAGIVTALLNYSALFSTSFLTANYLQVVRGLRPDEAGLTLLTTPIAQTALSPFAGWLSDRVGARPLASAGMACITAGLWLLAFAPADAGPLDLVPRLALIGLGMGLFSSPNTSAVMGAVDSSDLGVASGVLGTARQVGQSLSLAVLGAVAAAGLSPAEQQAIFANTGVNDPAALLAFAGGIHRAWFAAGCIAAVGIVTSLVRGGREVQ